MGEIFALLRIISITRFSGDDLKKEENQIYLFNSYHIARGNSVAGAYDDSKKKSIKFE
jgi:hypothetical protein